MINLRKLSLKDKENMYEWMVDNEINKNFRINFKNIQKDQIKNFIKNSYNKENIHLAIVNEEDEYLGTISLKNINYIDENAEYAIVLRKKALGSGVANIATNKILNIAFNDLNLKKVYLNVYSDNLRAIKFYEKMNFEYEGEFKKHLNINGEFKDIKWYAIYQEEKIDEF